jgi:hypothetical protein
MIVCTWGLLGFFAVMLAWARVTQSRKTYRVLWYVVVATVFTIGLVL